MENNQQLPTDYPIDPKDSLQVNELNNPINPNAAQPLPNLTDDLDLDPGNEHHHTENSQRFNDTPDTSLSAEDENHLQPPY